MEVDFNNKRSMIPSFAVPYVEEVLPRPYLTQTRDEELNFAAERLGQTRPQRISKMLDEKLRK